MKLHYIICLFILISTHTAQAYTITSDTSTLVHRILPSSGEYNKNTLGLDLGGPMILGIGLSYGRVLKQGKQSFWTMQGTVAISMFSVFMGAMETSVCIGDEEGSHLEMGIGMAVMPYVQIFSCTPSIFNLSYTPFLIGYRYQPKGEDLYLRVNASFMLMHSDIGGRPALRPFGSLGVSIGGSF